MESYTYIKGDLRVFTALDSVTATATSEAIDIAGATAVGIELIGEGTLANRSGELTVTVSNDGTNYRAYNMLIDNVANSNAQTLTRVASKTRDADGVDLLWLTPETLSFQSLKATLTVTDGTSPTGDFTVKITVLR